MDRPVLRTIIPPHVEPTRLEKAAACLRSAERAIATNRTFAAEALIAQASQHIHAHNIEIIDANA